MKKLKLDIGEDVARITLDRPEKKNAVDKELFLELKKATDKVKQEQKIVVLSGEGDTFCAGLDRNLLNKLASSEEEELEEMIEIVQEIFYDIRTLETPVIAAVEGYALGAGIQLALAGDVRIATPGAIFSVKEPEFGIVPDMGALHVLPRLVGDGRARDMIYTAREVETEEAKQIGLVDKVCKDLEKGTRDYVETLTSLSLTPMIESKPLIEKSWEMDLKESLKGAAKSQLKCIRKMKEKN